MNAHPSQQLAKFEVRCHAGNAGHLEVANDSVSVRIDQRIHRHGKDELWGTLLVQCKERDDGSLNVDVVVSHPEWDEPLKIASIQSYPCNGHGPEEILHFDFQQKQF